MLIKMLFLIFLIQRCTLRSWVQQMVNLMPMILQLDNQILPSHNNRKWNLSMNQSMCFLNPFVLFSFDIIPRFLFVSKGRWSEIISEYCLRMNIFYVFKILDFFFWWNLIKFLIDSSRYHTMKSPAPNQCKSSEFHHLVQSI